MGIDVNDPNAIQTEIDRLYIENQRIEQPDGAMLQKIKERAGLEDNSKLKDIENLEKTQKAPSGASHNSSTLAYPRPQSEKPYNIDEKINYIKNILQNAIKNKTDIIDVISLDDIGIVNLYYGNPGQLKNGRLINGSGISHIIEQRNLEDDNGVEVAMQIPEILYKGKRGKIYGPKNGERLNISHNGFTAVLSKFKNGKKENWIITGWRDNDVMSAVNAQNNYANQNHGISTNMGASSQIKPSTNSPKSQEEFNNIEIAIKETESEFNQKENNYINQKDFYIKKHLDSFEKVFDEDMGIDIYKSKYAYDITPSKNGFYIYDLDDGAQFYDNFKYAKEDSLDGYFEKHKAEYQTIKNDFEYEKFISAIEKLNIKPKKISDAGTGSTYINFISPNQENIKVRFANHPKLYDADISIDPDSPTTWQDAVRFVANKFNASAISRNSSTLAYPRPQSENIENFEKEKNIISEIISKISNKTKQYIASFKKVSPTEANIIKKETGIDVVGYSHAVENYGLNHALKEHGLNNEKVESQIPLTIEDLFKIPEIVSNFDKVSYVGKNKAGRDILRFEKQIGENYIYLEEVRTRKKQLVPQSMYKQKGKPVNHNELSEKEPKTSNAPLTKESLSQTSETFSRISNNKPSTNSSQSQVEFNQTENRFIPPYKKSKLPPDPNLKPSGRFNPDKFDQTFRRDFDKDASQKAFDELWESLRKNNISSTDAENLSKKIQDFSTKLNPKMLDSPELLELFKTLYNSNVRVMRKIPHRDALGTYNPTDKSITLLAENTIKLLLPKIFSLKTLPNFSYYYSYLMFSN